MRRAYTYRLAEFPVVDTRLYLINVGLYKEHQWSVIVQSCIVDPCHFVFQCPVLQCPPLPLSLSLSIEMSTLDILIVRHFPVSVNPQWDYAFWPPR